MQHPVRKILKQRELDLDHGSAIDAGYMHRAMCLAALPIKKPEKQRNGTHSEYVRQGDRCTLKLTTSHFHVPGSDHIVPVDVPFGREPRLLILWLSNYASQHRSTQYIEIGAVKEWVAAMGMAPNSTSLSKTKMQLISLSLTNFTAFVSSKYPDDSRIGIQQKPLIEQAIVDAEDMLHFEARRFDKIRWPEGIMLSKAAWTDFSEHLVPIPMDCLRPISNSATAIDIFTYLCYRLPLIDKGATELLTYRQMNAQFGSTMYKRNPKRFATVYGEAIRSALDAYTGAQIEEVADGFLLRHSDPATFARSFITVKLPTEPKRVRSRRPSQPKEDALLI